MDLFVDGFDWDEGNSIKCESHGVSILEIEALFRGQLRVAPDMTHSTEEERRIAIGRNQEGRPLFIAFTLRERDGRRLIRLPLPHDICMRGRLASMKRQVPRMTTDEEAEAFLEDDLSDLDFGQFKPVMFRVGQGATRPRVSWSRTESRSSYPPGVFLMPGTPTPQSGIYEQRGPRGGRTGVEADSLRGKPLPPAPKGRTWTLVESTRGKSGNSPRGYAKRPEGRGNKHR
jgi:uncharacterized DUF497 family protein